MKRPNIYAPMFEGTEAELRAKEQQQQKQYVFWYSETSTYKASFKAESLEQAEEQLDQMFSGEWDKEFGELPEWWETFKGSEIEWSPQTLREVK